MNRPTASQKSSRTMSRHCSRTPSHCRSAASNSRRSLSVLPCSHCSNWSITSSSFSPRGQIPPAAHFRQVFRQTASGPIREKLLTDAIVQVRFGVVRGRLQVDDPHVGRQTREQSGPDERRLPASRRTVQQPDRKRPPSRRRFQSASSTAESTRADHGDPAGPAPG